MGDCCCSFYDLYLERQAYCTLKGVPENNTGNPAFENFGCYEVDHNLCSLFLERMQEV